MWLNRGRVSNIDAIVVSRGVAVGNGNKPDSQFIDAMCEDEEDIKDMQINNMGRPLPAQG